MHLVPLLGRRVTCDLAIEGWVVISWKNMEGGAWRGKGAFRAKPVASLVGQSCVASGRGNVQRV